MKKFLSKPGLFLLPGVVAYILNKYAQNNTEWAEQYSKSELIFGRMEQC